MLQKLISFFLEEWIPIHSAWKAIYDIFFDYHMRGKITEYWLADTEGIFFLTHEGPFGNQEGMITWCWLATKRYCRWIFF